MIYIEFFAGMTTNGNTKRLFVVFNNDGLINSIYANKQSLKIDNPQIKGGERFTITPKDYNFYKKHSAFKN